MNKLSVLFLFCFFVKIKSQTYASSNFTLISVINPETNINANGAKYSSCWGWYQSSLNKEYAIAGSASGTYWVDVTNPATPTICAFRAGKTNTTVWREIKTYQNYCYVISDDGGPNSFQIFDMQYLPDSVHKVFDNQTLFKRGHTLTIDGNKLYVAGVTYSTGTTSSMDLYSLATPSAPVLVRRLNQDAPFINYVHDMYVENDTIFASCGNQGLYVFKYNSGTNTYTQLGSLTSYTAAGYNHSSAWTPDRKTLIMTDEVPTQLPIKLVNVQNLSNINVVATTNQYANTTPHNPFMVSNSLCFMASYQDGLQLYDISNPVAPFLAGYFDTFFQGGGNNNNWAGDDFDGLWSAYPYFPSKNIFALDQTNGLFMLSTHLYANPEINLQSNATNINDGSTLTNTANSTYFGTVTVGSNVTNSFVIQNNGVGNLSINSINITGANASEFTLIGAPALPFTVSPSSSQIFSIKYTPSSIGTASALITLSNNDLDETTYNFVVTGTSSVGINKINTYNNQSFNISIYPNPAQNQVQCSMPYDSKDLLVKIYNSEGQLVIEKTNEDITRISNTLLKLNVSELSNGIYYFTVIANAKRVYSKKLIISK